MNCKELAAAVARAGVKKADIANTLGISHNTLIRKMNGENEFKASEIRKLADILSLNIEQVNLIFFSAV